MSNNNLELYNQFRIKYPQFIYRGYNWELNETSLEFGYVFEIPGLSVFNPKWSISRLDTAGKNDIDSQKLETMVFSLGLVELISYWKLTCSPTVCIEADSLTPEQAAWWKKLFTLGLGEFFYTNGITLGEDFICIKTASSDTICYEKAFNQNESANQSEPTCQSKSATKSKFSNQSESTCIHNNYNIQNPQDLILATDSTMSLTGKRPRVLIPVGGGKDSVVTLELLKGSADRFGFIINPRGATRDTVEMAGLSNNTIIAKRTLDKNMLDLNTKGFLNGHTPFSAIVAFSSIIAAFLNKLSYVALSNESTANESTVIDSDINHQYSKSYEFETDFRAYEAKYLNSGIEYFSMLRPLAELQIAELFSKHKEYHKIFKSCNVGSSKNIWCGNCAKCLFVYIILSPYINEEELGDIFGKNLLNDISLMSDFKKLIGLHAIRPFECIGSVDEVKAALQLLIKKCSLEGRPIPELVTCYMGNYGDNDLFDTFENYFDEKNYIPPDFLKLLKQG